MCTDSNEFVKDCFKVQAVVQHNGLVTLAAFLSPSTPSILFLFLSRRSLRLLVDRLVDLLTLFCLLSLCLCEVQEKPFRTA